jgi:hypothetical protein
MLLNGLSHDRPGGCKAQPLSGEHVDHLPAACELRFEVPCCLVRQRADSRLHPLPKQRKNRSVNPVRFGEFTGGTGEVTHLARVHNDHRNTTGAQRGHQPGLKAARSFHDDQLWAQLYVLCS